MNYLDLACTSTLLVAIFMIPKHRGWWILYSFSAFLWIMLCVTKDLYFGVGMNILLFLLGIRNFRKGKIKQLD